MKKIIAAFDGYRFSESTLQYAVDLARCSNAYLVGVFLDDLVYHNYQFSDLVAQEGGVSDERIQAFNEKDQQKRDQSVHLFEESCKKAGVNYSVHRDRNMALQELLHESVYCDLVIIDRKETFIQQDEEVPTTFLKEFLNDVQCAVLVVPPKYQPVQKVVLLYDGDPSSVHAIKMFSYILPALKSERVEVLTVKNKEEQTFVPDNYLIKEFTKSHYPLADFIVLQGDAEEEILNYLRNQEVNPLVVLGAYSRNKVSRWFRPSMADMLLKNMEVPLFIAHNK